MAPSLQSSQDYGAIVEKDPTPTEKRLVSSAVRVATALGLVIAGVGLAAMIRSPSTQPTPDYLSTLSVDKHYCPHWPEFCQDTDGCVAKFHLGDAQSGVPVDMCEDYVADCKQYCSECDCPPPAETYCQAFLDSCTEPDKFVFSLEGKEVAKCPYGFEQVGVIGSGIDGCGLDGCTGPVNADIGWKLNEVACAASCEFDERCKAFTWHVDRKRSPVCKRFDTDVVSMSVASPHSEFFDRLVCKVSTNAVRTLNPDCAFENVASTILNRNRLYPYCPEGSIAFDFKTFVDVLCCTGTCDHGHEGDADDDVICKIDEISTQNYPVCTGFGKKQCLWAYGAAEARSVTSYFNYKIKAYFTYDGPSASFLFRMQSSTQEVASRYMLKFDGTKEVGNVALVFYDGVAETETELGNPVGVKFQSGKIADTQIPEASFKADIDAAIAATTAANTAGYCNAEDPDVTYYSSETICFHGEEPLNGAKITANFVLKEATVLKFKINNGYDWGSMVYLDGEPMGYRAYTQPGTFETEHTLTEGPHSIEIYGAQSTIKGGGVDIKFQSKPDLSEAVYGPEVPLTRHYLMSLGPKVPEAVAPNVMHKINIRVEENVFSVEIDGNRYMTFTDNDKRSGFGTIGLATWKSTMTVHHLQFLTLEDVPVQTTYEGYMQTQGGYEMYVDGVLAYSGVDAANKLVKFNADVKILALKFEQIVVPKECKEGDVHMTDYPTGHPYYRHAGKWRPICAELFNENDNGCSAVCQQVGYPYLGATLKMLRNQYSVAPYLIGMCEDGQELDNCGDDMFGGEEHPPCNNLFSFTCTCAASSTAVQGGIHHTCLKEDIVHPAFAFAVSRGHNEPVEILSVDHSSGTVGKHFNFNWADLEVSMGSKLASPQHLVIWNVRTHVQQAAVLWNNKDGGTNGDSHGRWDPYELSHEYDWQARDLFFTKATHKSLSSLVGNEENWKCEVTNKLTDDNGNAWYSKEYDRTSWQPAAIMQDGSVSTEVAGVLGSNSDETAPSWIGVSDLTGTCEDGSVMLSSYPKGIPFIYSNKRFHPICGDQFANNRYGCDLVCKGLGYDGSDGGSPAWPGTVMSKIEPEGDAIMVGQCLEADTDLKACTGGQNTWPGGKEDGSCRAGQAVATTCSCVGDQGGAMHACSTGAHTLCVMEVPVPGEAAPAEEAAAEDAAAEEAE